MLYQIIQYRKRDIDKPINRVVDYLALVVGQFVFITHILIIFGKSITFLFKKQFDSIFERSKDL